jgi:hypothetical protein
MKKIGSFFIIIGLLAIVLNYINRVPRLLMWIYQWGEGVAWGIKISLIVLGAILYLAGRKRVAG